MDSVNQIKNPEIVVDQQQQEEVEQIDPNTTFRPHINPKSQNMQRSVNDLYLWKENADQKREQLKQQLEDEEREEINFVNPKSLIFLQKREQISIEEQLTKKGEETKAKLKMVEQTLYESKRQPSINQKVFENIGEYQQTQVYDRLYNDKLHEQWKFQRPVSPQPDLGKTQKTIVPKKELEKKYDKNEAALKKTQIKNDFEISTALLKLNIQNGKKREAAKSPEKNSILNSDTKLASSQLINSSPDKSVKGDDKKPVIEKSVTKPVKEEDMQPYLSDKIYYQQELMTNDQDLDKLQQQYLQTLNNKIAIKAHQEQQSAVEKPTVIEQPTQPTLPTLENQPPEIVQEKERLDTMCSVKDQTKLFNKQQKWLEQQQFKLEEKRIDHENTKMTECTFKPKILDKDTKSKIKIVDSHQKQTEVSNLIKTIKNEGKYSTKEKIRKTLK